MKIMVLLFLSSYKTTALLNIQEQSAYYLTKLWLKDYYRTYPITVEDAVKSKLIDPSSQFIHGKHPFTRDSYQNFKPALVVEDRNYISARWPGDTHKFGTVFLNKLQQKRP